MIFETAFLLLGLIQVFGFFVEGAAGFGCTVISAPFATSILGVETGVPFGTMMALPFIAILAFRSRKNISWKDLGKIFLACLPGLLCGQFLFYMVNPDIAKVGIGLAVTLIAVFKIWQNIVLPKIRHTEIGEESPDTLPKKIFRYTCLIVGGIVHGAFNIGGPLITVYTLEAVKDKVKFRNTMVGLWTILNFLNAVNQIRNGSLTPYLGSALLVCYPFAAVGFIAGVKFLNKINKETFLKFIYIVLFAVGLNTLIRSLLVVI